MIKHEPTKQSQLYQIGQWYSVTNMYNILYHMYTTHTTVDSYAATIVLHHQLVHDRHAHRRDAERAEPEEVPCNK